MRSVSLHAHERERAHIMATVQLAHHNHPSIGPTGGRGRKVLCQAARAYRTRPRQNSATNHSVLASPRGGHCRADEFKER